MPGKGIIPRVIGKDASAVEEIWQDLWQATMTYGRGGIATMAMSALDIALWDALGKRANLPLHRLVGAFSHASCRPTAAAASAAPAATA